MYAMIDCRLLEQLDAVARNKTLSAAAQELGVSQPAISKSMKRLEELLGVELFERSGPRTRLNETGEYAADLAGRILRLDREFADRVVAFDNGLHNVCIGVCAPWPSMVMGGPAQRYFMDKTVSFALVGDDAALVDGLRSSRYQLVVLHGAVQEPGVCCEPIATESVTVSFKKGSPFAGRGSIRFADLADETILAWGPPSFWTSWLRNLCPGTILFQDEMAAVDELVKKTDLPTFSSDRMAEAGYRDDSRVDVPVEDDAAQVTYYLAFLESQAEKYAPLVRWLAR